jgi:CubicO group peptidase (beta-lactamase class C family)
MTPVSNSGLARVEEALDDAVARGVFPGAVLRIGIGGETVLERAVGARAIEPERAEMHGEVVFDLSSLTKPLATTLAFFALVADGRVTPDEPLVRALPELAACGKAELTYRQLLSHSSGLPAHRRYFDEIARREREGRPGLLRSRQAKEETLALVRREPLEAPPGTRALYSDLGFILLGEAVEAISGERLDRFCRARFYAPLGLDDVFFVDLSPTAPPRPRFEIAATQRCPWRGHLLCGEVDDDNSWAMGGIAGHAGLFGSARAVDRVAEALHAAWLRDGGVLPRALVERMWTIDERVPGSTRTLGWDTPAPGRSMAGSRMSRRTVGHLGFTGTSLWIDLERGVRVVLLTNRIHPSRDNAGIAEFRPRIHDLIMEAL